MRVDYQRIADEMYEPRDEREPRSKTMLIIGFVLLVGLPLATLLFFAGVFLSFAHELRGF